MNEYPCPDCGAKPNDLHADGCDVERCPGCGGQRLFCDCDCAELPRLPWSGEWPGVAECREFGWFERGRPSLNRLAVDADWNVALGRWVRR